MSSVLVSGSDKFIPAKSRVKSSFTGLYSKCVEEVQSVGVGEDIVTSIVPTTACV